MNAVKGIYHDGIVELIEKPKIKDLTEVIIIYPDSKKSINKIGGLYKNYTIDYEQTTKDLKELSQKTEGHLLKIVPHE